MRIWKSFQYFHTSARFGVTETEFFWRCFPVIMTDWHIQIHFSSQVFNFCFICFQTWSSFESKWNCSISSDKPEDLFLNYHPNTAPLVSKRSLERRENNQVVSPFLSVLSNSIIFMILFLEKLSMGTLQPLKSVNFYLLKDHTTFILSPVFHVLWNNKCI